ncbi:MAG TPA: carboxypeptidase regulatory-like domain-containing protein [Candidatus Cybelea sp.]|nr:carboxypeptidase regulatory-like domain-containing protein [Candidatus Cybelea sp.]
MKWIHFLGMVALLCLCAGTASAQGNNRIDGQVLDLDGKPLPDATVTIKGEASGQVFTLKTDKNGKFVQIGLKAGLYDLSVNTNNPQMPPFNQKFQLAEGQSATIPTISYKELANSPEAKKRAEEQDVFKNMKAHFDAGRQALTEADALGQQIRTAPADQKSALQEKRTADCQSAASNFEEAAKGVQAKDVKNLATVLQNLGAADECAGRYDDAVSAFQKAVDTQPSPGEYNGLSTNLANAAVAQNDPTVLQTKLTQAGADCEKAAALDGSSGTVCWKNLGIVLYNKQRQKEATTPFQKVTAANPKDAQAWFLLGSCLSAQIDSKQEGGKEIYVIPSGTTEAYQKCIDAAPNGPYAPQCKAGLDELAQLSGGVSTSMGKKKSH